MNYKKVALFLIFIASTRQIFAPVTGVHLKKMDYSLPKGLAPLFEYIGIWEGKPFGWLLVRDGKHIQGKVLAQLAGASYTNPKIAGDYSISYVGYDSNGCYMTLPTGLYAWQNPKDSTNFQTIPIRPALRNRFGKHNFDYDHNSHFWYEWKHDSSSKHPIKWEPKKEKYPHPSKEISDIVGG